MIKPHNTNTEFELGGINHVALVCSDMARTGGLLQQHPRHAADQIARPARRGGAALLLRRRQRRLRRVLLVRRRPRPGAGYLVAGRHPRHRRHHQRGEHHEPSGIPRAGREVRRLPAAAQGQGRAGRPGAQPRRERNAGVRDGASRGVRALVLLPGPRRHHTRIRVLGKGIRHQRRPDDTEDRVRPATSGGRPDASRQNRVRAGGCQE